MGGLTRGTEKSVPHVQLATSFAGTNIGLLAKMIPTSSLALIRRTHLHCVDSRDSHSSFSSKLELEDLLMYEMLKTRLADPLCTASTVDDRVFGSRT